MWMIALAGVCLVTLTNVFTAHAETGERLKAFDGPYVYEGTPYALFQKFNQPGGYVEEYTNKEGFCGSFLFAPGFSFMNDIVVGVFLLIVLFYVFLGVAIIADLFMEAIEVITSKVEVVEMFDDEGKKFLIEKPVWNATIANLTLMALGSSAPEILLSVIETVTGLEETPSELGA